jgi:pimeloyl-ACP methyl ester carboxylesterase
MINLHTGGRVSSAKRVVLPGLAVRLAILLIGPFLIPALGLTARYLSGAWPGGSPYSPEAQADLLFGLMDALSIERAILIGNSAGAAVAFNASPQHPDRVIGLALVDAAIYTSGGAPSWLRPLLRTPGLARFGPLFVRSIRTRGDQLQELAWHDPSRVTPEIHAGYTKPLSAQDWDRGLWELTVAGRDLNLDERLQEVSVPALVITGDDDRIVPTADSIRLAGELPGAELVVIPACGHVPQEECPDDFLFAVESFITRYGGIAK